MLYGRSVVTWIAIAIIAVIAFFVAQWLIPVLFALVTVDIPLRIVNMLALLLALGVVYGGYTRGVGV